MWLESSCLLEYSYCGCQSSVTQIDLIGLQDVLGLHRSPRTTDCGLRTRTTDEDSWQPGSPREVLHSLYIEGQDPAQRIILSSNSTLFSAAHTITHILVISSISCHHIAKRLFYLGWIGSEAYYNPTGTDVQQYPDK